MRNRCNSQQLQSIPQLKDMIYSMQQRDAQLRLQISHLQKQLKEKNEQYLDALKQISELKKIQKRDNQYFQRMDEYITKLKNQLKITNAKLNTQQKQRNNSNSLTHYSSADTYYSTQNNSLNQNEIPQKPKQFKLNIKQCAINNQINYRSQTEASVCNLNELTDQYRNYTEQSDIYQLSSEKSSHFQEQLMNRILDNQETWYSNNSQYNNFSFANSEKKQEDDWKKYNSLSLDDKENERWRYNM